ncbi:MAG: tetratricopeptide repeat protein [Limisphaerales bacterium]
MSVPAFESKAPAGLHFCRKDLLASLALVLAVAVVFGGLYWADFINLDDYEYVKFNVHLAQGFTWMNLKWAFTPGYASNWHPLTWISHILDYKWFGLNPAGHHLMNVGFHAANAVVLFLFLRWLSGRFWECLLVVTLFALHPLRVESVAWIAERKDVLSTFLVLLCIWTYSKYARAKASGSANGAGSYLTSIFLFALALMAKPMSVTVPFVLLLLDFWPFGRWLSCRGPDANRRSRITRVISEKLPFFLLSAVTCLLTLKAQTHAISSLNNYPFWARLGNAVVAYATYLHKILWPTDLSIMYPLAVVPWQTLVISTGVVLSISVAATCAARKWPYVTFGWFWYIGTLVPTIGLVQVGAQSFADRYTYLPTVGILIAIIWWAAEIITRPQLRVAAIGAAGIVLLSFGLCTRYETTYWRNAITLFAHGLKNTTNNFFLISGMASVLGDSGIPGISKQAAFYYDWAFLISPSDAKLNYNYGNFLARRNFYDEALPFYDKAIAGRRDYAEAYFDKANTLAVMGRFAEAETNYTKALEIDPSYVNAEVNFAGIFTIRHQYDHAIPHYNRALQLAPQYARAHHLMGVTLARMGRMEEAVDHFRLAVRYFDKPDVTVWNDLAWMLAVMQVPSVHNPIEAVRLGETACQLSNYSEPAALDTLAVAYAEAGKFDAAVRIADKTITIVRAKGSAQLLTEMERRKKLYLNRTPYRTETVTEERPVKSMLDLTPRK